jgi:hypothetical protein
MNPTFLSATPSVRPTFLSGFAATNLETSKPHPKSAFEN